MTKYWHNLSRNEQGIILQRKDYTVGQLMAEYSQPAWCGEVDALAGNMGCWSLLYGRVHAEGACRGCRFIQAGLETGGGVMGKTESKPIPEVFALFEGKLATIISIDPIEFREEWDEAVRELLYYFNDVVGRAIELQARNEVAVEILTEELSELASAQEPYLPDTYQQMQHALDVLKGEDVEPTEADEEWAFDPEVGDR